MSDARTPVGEQSLIIHAFARVGADGDWRGPAQRLWSTLKVLGHVIPLPDAGTGTDVLPPPSPEASTSSAGFTVLAAGQVDRAGVRQGFVYRYGDVVGLAVTLSPPAGDWSQLDSEWPAVDGEILGIVRLYVGVVPAAGLKDGGVDGLLPPGLTTIGSALHPAAETSVWELTRPGDDAFSSERRLLALAGAAWESDLYAWAWGAAGHPPHLTPLMEHLMSAATMRSAWRLLRSESGFRTSAQAVSAATDRLVQLHVSSGSSAHSGVVSITELTSAEAALTLALGGALGLTVALRDLRAIRHAAQLNLLSMQHCIPDPGPAGGNHPDPPVQPAWITSGIDRTFGQHDQALAHRLVEQLTSDIEALQATVDSAERVAAAGRAFVDRRLRLRQERITVLQASLVGALLMALSAIQAFGFHAPLASRVQGPVIVLLSLLALALPPVVLRFAEADLRTARLGGLDQLLIAFCGAATGWLVLIALSVSRRDATPPAAAALAAAAVGFAVALLLLALQRGLPGRRHAAAGRRTQQPDLGRGGHTADSDRAAEASGSVASAP